MSILKKYSMAVKWILTGSNKDIILSTGERINEKLKDKETREKWEKINSEISAEAEKDMGFRVAVDEILERLDKEYKNDKKNFN